MRTVYKSIAALSIFLTADPAVACVSPLAAKLSTSKEKASNANVGTCDATYSTPTTKMTACNACKPVLDKYKSEVPSKVDSVVANDTGLTCNSAAGATRVGGGATGQQQNADLSAGGVTSIGSLATRQSSEASAAASAWFKKCQDEISNKCKAGTLAGTPMRTAADKLYAACETGASTTSSHSAQKASDSMSLGDLAKSAGSLAQLMGAAAQLAGAMNKGPAADSTPSTSGGLSATSPTPGSGLSGDTTPKTETASLGGASQQTPGTVGFGNPVSGAGVGTSASQGASSGSDSSGSGSSRSPSSTGGFGSGGGAGVGSSGGLGSGGGGGGIRDSSGASTMGGGGAGSGAGGGQANTGGSFEIGPGGLSGRAAMMGLKAGSTELDDFAKAGEQKSEPLSSLDNPSGNGAGAAAGTEPNDTETLFNRVRERYGLLAGKGRF